MAQPIVKWAGGKTQLLDRIQDLSPEHFDNYFEPFSVAQQYFLILQAVTTILNISSSAILILH